MSTLYHPNIVLFMGACSEPGKLVMVTQYLRGGSVLQMLDNRHVDIKLLHALSMARDTCLGMNWLHSRNPSLLHLDLKPANLLIDTHGSVKVADFGISILVERGADTKDQGRLRGNNARTLPRRELLGVTPSIACRLVAVHVSGTFAAEAVRRQSGRVLVCHDAVADSDARNTVFRFGETRALPQCSFSR